MKIQILPIQANKILSLHCFSKRLDFWRLSVRIFWVVSFIGILAKSRQLKLVLHFEWLAWLSNIINRIVKAPSDMYVGELLHRRTFCIVTIMWWLWET